MCFSKGQFYSKSSGHWRIELYSPATEYLCRIGMKNSDKSWHQTDSFVDKTGHNAPYPLPPYSISVSRHKLVSSRRI